MNKALFVANYIIEYSNKMGYEINNLKLQKLLYFINARSLVETGKPIFEEKILKWKYGPVVKNVYEEYRRFGASSINEKNIIEIDFSYYFDDKTNFVDFLENLENKYSSDKILNKFLIEDTVDKLQKFSYFELMDKTRSQSIWIEDKIRIKKGIQNISYNNIDIKNFFLENKDFKIWR